MERKLIIAFVFLVLTGFLCQAQGFDDLKKAKPVVFNKKLQAVVNNNDVKGLEKLLTSKPETKNDGSNFGKNDRGAILTIPLFYDVVDKTLSGTVSIEACRVCLAAGCDVYTVYNGKTPIYRVMDFFATTPSDKCEIGMEVLKLLVAQKGFDLNRRYRSLPPPFSYLLSENFKYLGNNYSKDYLSTELIRYLIDNGAYLNSYDENGASLLSLAISTNNVYLQNYLVDNGVNIDKAADTEGNNGVIAAIADNNVPLLEKIVKNYNVQLTTPLVKDWTSKVSPDMFDYLVGQCADHANTYEEIVEFRTHFSNRKDVVQDKYENLAKKEVSNTYTYEGIMECKKRYPDLANITEPKFKEIANNEISTSKDIAQIKVCENRYPDFKAMTDLKKNEIYLNDVKKLEESYSHAKNLVAKSSFYYESRMSDIANSFVNNYQNYYDPDNQLPLAKDLSRFYSALSSVNQGYYSRYHLLPQPGLFKEEMIRDQNRLKSAYDNLYSCGHGLSSEEMLSAINQILQEAKKAADKSINEYREFCDNLKKNIKVKENIQPYGELTGGEARKFRNNGQLNIEWRVSQYHDLILVTYHECYEYDGWGKYREGYYEINGLYSSPNYYYDMLNAEKSYYSNWLDINKYQTLSALETGIINRIVKYFYSFL